MMREFSGEINKALDLLFKVEKPSSVKKQLLGRGKIVYLQINVFKVPLVSRRRRKFLKLCHSLYGDDPEICLFVPNKKTGTEYKQTTEEFIDFCVDHYTELLEKHKVKGIKTVMPLKQLRSEYGGYELRRKLVQRFDIFLCKNSLLHNSKFLTALGKIFRVANKEPLGVAFPKEGVEYDPQFNENIHRALFASTFFIQPYSDNYSVPIGTLSNSKLELAENLKSVLSQLCNEDIIPGGFKNIRAMYIWPSQSKTIPLYVSTELPMEMERPRLKSRGKGHKAVEGELSTQPGMKVRVTPSGEVFITNDGKSLEHHEVDLESDSGSFNDDSFDEDLDGEVKSASRSNHNAKAVKEEGSESESEDDEEIEKKEQLLLKLKRQADGVAVSDSKKRKSEDEILGHEDEEEIGEKKENKKLKITGKEIKKQMRTRDNGRVKVGKNVIKLQKKEKKKNEGQMNKAKKKSLIKQKKAVKREKAKRTNANNKLKLKEKN